MDSNSAAQVSTSLKTGGFPSLRAVPSPAVMPAWPSSFHSVAMRSSLRPRRLSCRSCSALMSFRRGLRDGLLLQRDFADLVEEPGVHAGEAGDFANAIYSPIVISNAAPWRTVRQLRHAYTRQVKLAALDLRNAVATDIQQLYADNNGDPTSQQMANLTASVEGAVDATALQLSSEASLLPASSNRLVPAIQNSLLGSGSRSLATTLNSILQSAGNTATAQQLQRTLGRVIAMAPANWWVGSTTTSARPVSTSSPLIAAASKFPFRSTWPISSSANLATRWDRWQKATRVSPTRCSIPMTWRATSSQVASQALTSEFNTMASNALATAAMQLGSDLSLFSGDSSVASQLDPLLFGTTTSTTTPGMTGTTGTQASPAWRRACKTF